MKATRQYCIVIYYSTLIQLRLLHKASTVWIFEVHRCFNTSKQCQKWNRVWLQIGTPNRSGRSANCFAFATRWLLGARTPVRAGRCCLCTSIMCFPNRGHFLLLWMYFVLCYLCVSRALDMVWWTDTTPRSLYGDFFVRSDDLTTIVRGSEGIPQQLSEQMWFTGAATGVSLAIVFIRTTSLRMYKHRHSILYTEVFDATAVNRYFVCTH